LVEFLIEEFDLLLAKVGVTVEFFYAGGRIIATFFGY
jgi:hypothetical protein